MYEGQHLKEKLKAGEICLGTWNFLSDPTVAELLSGSGFDFFIIDAEHCALDLQTIQLNIMAAKGAPITSIVRVAWNDPVLIKRVLDAGAGGVLIPLIRNDEDVRNAVAACLYPPAGIRGHGPRRPSNYWRLCTEYVATANEDIVIWAQIEHVDAVANIERIVAVPGLSGLVIGRCDLSGSMGILGQVDHPDVLAAIDRVLAVTRAAGVPTGIVLSADPAVALQWIEKGMQFVTLDCDDGYLVSGTQAAVNGVKKLLAGKDSA